jgi:hypothetical protein
MNYVFAVTIAALASVVCFKLTRSLLGALLLGGEMHEPETTKVLEADSGMEGNEDNDEFRNIENGDT